MKDNKELQEKIRKSEEIKGLLSNGENRLAVEKAITLTLKHRDAKIKQAIKESKWETNIYGRVLLDEKYLLKKLGLEEEK